MKRKTPEQILQVHFAIYANVAISSIERFLGFKHCDEYKDPINKLLDDKNPPTDEEKLIYWKLMKKNLDVIGYLQKENLWLHREEDKQYELQALANYERFIHLIALLNDIRNYWSHYKHREPEVSNAPLPHLPQHIQTAIRPLQEPLKLLLSNENNATLDELLIHLYNQATLNVLKEIPNNYAGRHGLFKFEEKSYGTTHFQLNDRLKLKGDYTHHLTFTGHIFTISLFLCQHEVSEFLNTLEQAPYTVDERKGRQAWHEQHIGEPFLDKEQQTQLHQHRKEWREKHPVEPTPDYLRGSDKEKQRKQWRENHPIKAYPKELRLKKKHFLYARQVYTRFAIRGHRDTETMADEYQHRQKAFELFEYLKRCPIERLSNRVAQNKQAITGATIDTGVTEIEKESSDSYLKPHRAITIDGQDYALREKNKFLEYALDFLQEEWEYLRLHEGSNFQWKWARHASAQALKDLKDDLIKNDPMAKLPKHQKIIWDIPHQDAQLLNDRQEEYGFPWYFERDKNGQYSQAVFKLTFADKKTNEATKKTPQRVIGRLGSEALCTILENYFKRFPIRKEATNIENRKRFFTELFQNILDHIVAKTDRGRGHQPKPTLTPAIISRRIAFLRQKWEAEQSDIDRKDKTIEADPFRPSLQHTKILYIAQTWNKMITFGQTNNLAHAKDYKGITGGINGYRDIIKQLSLLTNETPRLREHARDNLTHTLQKLGNRNGVNYYQAINNQIKYSGMIGNSGSPHPMKKKKTLHDLYLQAKDYRMAMLNKMEEALQHPFHADNWRPEAEMRWLGLRDERTPLVSQNIQKQPQEQQTDIYNVDQHYYASVGVQIKALKGIQAGLVDTGERDNQLINCHTSILKPNDNQLWIEAFYHFDNWQDLPRTDRQRLYAVKRQDVVLAQLAYQYTLEYESEEYHHRTIDSLNFQNHLIKLPVAIQTTDGLAKGYVSCYYRHYKQNRYRLLTHQVENLMQIIIGHQLIPGYEIALNNLIHKKREELSQDDKWRLLSHEEQKMRAFERMQLADKKVAEIKKEIVLVPVPDKERHRFYLTDLLASYQICRQFFLEKVFALEEMAIEQLNLTPNQHGYIKFKNITKAMKRKQWMTEEQGRILNALRNRALHNKIPVNKDDLQLLPETNLLVQRVRGADKQRTGPEYIDFFGKGMQLAIEVLTKVQLQSNVE